VETTGPDHGDQEPLPPPSLSPTPPGAAQPGPGIDVPGGAGLSAERGSPAEAPQEQPQPPAPYGATPPPGAQPPPYGTPPAPYAAPPPPGAQPPPYGALPAPYAAPPPPPGYSPGGYGYTYPSAGADGPAPGLRYAGFGIRTAAYLLDGIIIFIVVLLVSPALGGFTRSTVTDINGLSINTQEINPAVELFEFLLGALYFVGFWSLATRTPGMMPFHLRVLRAIDGRPIGIGMALVRYIGLLISFFVILLGVIWVAIDPRRQGWHDKMAGTFVVQEVQPGTWRAT